MSITQRANDALGAADAGLAVNPNFARLYLARAIAENALGRFEQAKSDVLLVLRLSPRDPEAGYFHELLGYADLGLGRFDASIEESRRAIDAGFKPYISYAILAAAYALDGKPEKAQSALAEARRLNPKLTVKWRLAHGLSFPALIDGLRKAGLPEE